MPRRAVTVTINREAIKAAIKARILAAIAAHAGDIPHTNRDALYSPARWWSDVAHTDRYTLTTGATLAVVDGGIHITLTFQF